MGHDVAYEGMNTPWGAAQSATKIIEGMYVVDTPSHGGLKLSRQRNAEVPKYMRRPGGWYEEDCEWSIPFVLFESELRNCSDSSAEKAINENHHIDTFRNWFPEQYEQFFDVTLNEGESSVRDEQLFADRNKNNWVTTAAWGDWHSAVPQGQVAVVATLGGVRDGSSVQKHFLVPKSEYDSRKTSFVVDPSRHQEIAPIQ